jgi:hypothetical protein
MSKCEHEYLDIIEEYEQGLSTFVSCECSLCGFLVEVEKTD